MIKGIALDFQLYLSLITIFKDRNMKRSILLLTFLLGFASFLSAQNHPKISYRLQQAMRE
jgi:hypothetical protein